MKGFEQYPPPPSSRFQPLKVDAKKVLLATSTFPYHSNDSKVSSSSIAYRSRISC